MDKLMPTISAIIIAKNEQARIGRCLDSVHWTDEMIVVDNSSEDSTIAIAKKHNAKIISSKEKSFAKIREQGAKEATGDWILYVDADEEVTHELRLEIQSKIQLPLTDQPIAYTVVRQNYYLGQLWPFQERLERLFYKKSLDGWFGDVHETPNVKGAIGQLNKHLIHHTHRTLEEMVAKTNEWSDIEAQLRESSGHPSVVWWRFLRVMMTGFMDSFIRQGGWKAGTVGWIESIYQAFSMFITYAKLWELQQAKHKTSL